jgi:CheY-like chemotaxis protein
VRDVVLMDLRRPGLDGVGATRQIVAAGRSAVRVTYDTDGDIARYRGRDGRPPAEDAPGQNPWASR